MKKLMKLLIFLALVALLIIGAVRLVKKRKAQEAAIPPAKEYALIVKTLVPKKKYITLSTDYLALVQSDTNTKLLAKFAGRIMQIKDTAERVKKGEVVARLDTTPLRAKLTSIQSQIEATRSQIAAAKEALANLYSIHARTKKLYAVKGASKEQLEREAVQIAEAKAKLAALQSKLASLKASKTEIRNELSYAVLKSPIDGVVAKKFVSIGDIAMPGHPLLAINSSSHNYLLVRLPGNLHPAGLLYKGKRYNLKALQSSFDSLSEYRADVADPTLVAGEMVACKVITYEGSGVLLPYDAILNRGGKSYVLQVEGDQAKALQVHIVASGEEGVVIQEDLGTQEIVVAKPDILLKLLSGLKLKALK